MVEPTGYSALDLIGFTDKGDYAAGSTYVKNDVVHYGGNMWLCKLDDTTGHTPAEGTYWTLWLESDTTLASMTDTQISSPVDGDVLEYNSTASKWKNSGTLKALKGAYTENVNVNGSKNILPIICQDGTRQGITISNNGEYLTVSGTASGNPTTISLFDEDLVPVSSSYGTAKTLKELGIDNTKTYIFSRPSSAGNIRYGIWLFNGSTKLTDLELNNETLEIDFPNTYPTCDRLKFSLAVTSGAVVSSGTAFKPMFCLKIDYDFDSTWVPFASSNRALSRNKVSWSDEAQIGAVNVFPVYTNRTETSSNGVSVVFDNDGIMTFSGTPSANSLITCSETFVLKKGTYKISGSPYVNDDTVQIGISVRTDSSTLVTNTSKSNNGGENIFTVSADTACKMYCYVKQNFASTGMVCKPIVTPILDYTGPYAPYAMTNKELTDYTTASIASLFNGNLDITEISVPSNTETKIISNSGVYLIFISGGVFEASALCMAVIHGSSAGSSGVQKIYEATPGNLTFNTSVVKELKVTSSNYSLRVRIITIKAGKNY